MTESPGSLYVFGSYARGDHDIRSDLDILSIVESGSGTNSEQVIQEVCQDIYPGIMPNVSWYSKTKITEMFSNGDLFTWHLYRESKLIYGIDILNIIGTPKPYVRATEDIIAFRDVFQSTEEQLEEGASNFVYDLGVFYVCMRNIAMSASYILNGVADFTREAPYHLGALSCPVDRDLYLLAMECRSAGQRGGDIPSGASHPASKSIARLAPDWISRILSAVDERKSYD